MSRFSFLRSDRQAPASGKARSDYVADEDFNTVSAAPKRGGRQKEAADPALPEKKRARRRLVGAVTLTLVAVIVLPLVFDPEPKPVFQDIAIDVSSRSKTTQSAKTTASEPAHEPQTATSPATAPVAAVAGVAGVAAATTVKIGAAPAEAPKPEAKPADPAPKQAAKPAAESKPAASEQGKYIIQVAALASQKKVDELRAKLKSAGIKSHTQKVATKNGERIRVRVGPLGTRKEADGMCAKLGKIGQQCTIIPA